MTEIKVYSLRTMATTSYKSKPTAVRSIELTEEIQALQDVTSYQRVRTYVTHDGDLLGMVEIDNEGQVVSAEKLRETILYELKWTLLEHRPTDYSELAATVAVTADDKEQNSMSTYVKDDNRFVPFSQFMGKNLPTWIIDLSQPLEEVADVSEHDSVRIIFTQQGKPLGWKEITTHRQPLTKGKLRSEIAKGIGVELVTGNIAANEYTNWLICQEKLANIFFDSVETTAVANPVERLALTEPVSIVIATLDRPDDLRECLLSLMDQDTERDVEIIVVDNNPDSGLTPPVVAEFPGIILVDEQRKGLAYARNAGFTASTGNIAVATDDDVIFPKDWLERLLAPFSRKDVMIVTGNVLPIELETDSQRLFESYGGLGRGFKRLEVNGDWFDHYRFKSVPTWELGATANAAFRTSIFQDPDIGLMEESLGPGTPAGVGEDTYLFYKVLKAGWTLVYEPRSYVWHKHRSTMEALRRQLYNYSKGHIAYHTKLFVSDGDWRGLTRIFIEMPMYHWWRFKQRLKGQSIYPLSLLSLEIRGALAGIPALWRSQRRVKRLGRSSPYISPELRPHGMDG